MDRMRLAEAERGELAELLRGLDEGEWHAPTLCAGWRVRDVVAHLIGYDLLPGPEVGALFVRGRFGVDRVNALALAVHSGLSTDELADRVAAHLRPRGLTAGFGGAIALTDGMVHQQDIRRPLGRPRDIPAERLRAALDFAVRAPTLPARRIRRGLRLTATDLPWTMGDGVVVEGTAEALLMVLAGRPTALADVEGPGVAVARRRMSDPA